MRVGDTLADVAVVQVGTSEAPRLEVAVTTDTPVARGRTRAETTAMLRRLLGLEIELGDFYRCAERDPDLHRLAGHFRGLKPPRFLSLFEARRGPLVRRVRTPPRPGTAGGLPRRRRRGPQQPATPARPQHAPRLRRGSSRRVTSRWAPYSGFVYFHFLLAGIDEAGWLDGRGKPGERENSHQG
ncbi:MAG: hypothetical protein M3Q30_20695 [Actinomycetota bacterium]|nr:hypothetical protein [Actinomycetota bacterium]